MRHVARGVLAELEEADVRQIYIFNDRGRSTKAMIIGFNGKARAF